MTIIFRSIKNSIDQPIIGLTTLTTRSTRPTRSRTRRADGSEPAARPVQMTWKFSIFKEELDEIEFVVELILNLNLIVEDIL